MTPERWQQVKAPLLVALELTPPSRAAYLDQACAGDQPLRDELDRLLMADEMAGAGFLSHPAILPGLSDRALQAPVFWIGRRVGAYEIVAPLGAGGMGEVYRMARAVLARALLAQNRLDEARKAIVQSSALLGKSEDREASLGLRITEGRVAAASGQTSVAAKTIEATRREAAKAGLVGAEFEARLALGELEMKSGKGAAGRSNETVGEQRVTAAGPGTLSASLPGG